MSDLGTLLALIAISLVALILATMLVGQTRQRSKLLAWLKDPQQHEIPDGIGTWCEIFSQLQRLRKEELRIRTALGGNLDRFLQASQALPDGVILLDAESHIEWLNVAACEHFGLDANRDIGTLVVQLIRQTDFNDMFSDFRAGRNVPPLVIKLGTNGSRRMLSLMLVSFADSGIMLLSRDISEIARAEIMRRDFIANVSHELRTPLTVITGFLEQLTAAPLEPAQPIGGFLTLMSEQAQRMNRLVDDLLRLSRLENTTEPPRDDDIDIAKLMESLLTEARLLSRERHRIELGYVCECWIRGSNDEIRSAFSNLVSNAVRYTPADGTITLSFEGQGPQLAFTVTDTGIGIPPEHIPRLTERFYRVDKGRSAETGGTGLGLAIVKHVLARHQGTLSIRSKVGQGSTFMAFLPSERRIALKA